MRSRGSCVLRRDGRVSLVGNRVSPSAQVLCLSAPRMEPPAPTWLEGAGGGGGLSSGHVLCLQSKSPAHVTIGSGLMKLSTDGYFVVVL